MRNDRAKTEADTQRKADLGKKDGADPDVEVLAEMVEYQPGSVVSRKILGAKRGNVTLFAFDEGEGLTEHTSPYEARVVVLDGEAEIRIGGQVYRVGAGETLLLPASVPHALDARERFK
ncbi:MAG: cupin domain-containing protein, partial [Gemmatimonadota bacterium]